MMKLYSYKMGSQSAKVLAEALGIKRIKHEGKLIHVKGTLINWGSSFIAARVNYKQVLNDPEAVKIASNKLSTFKALEGKVRIPEFTTDSAEACSWIDFGKATIVARHKLTGHSGEGIEIVDSGDWFEEDKAPLYTKYIKKKEEYRIHVFQGDAFFVQRKARKKDVPDDQVNWKVRNLAGGFIFANQNIEVDQDGLNQAVEAVKALGLDFGAVDIIKGTDGFYYVLEVNTACGLEGTTLEKYAEKFRKYL